jgi:hypothetical protein
MTRLPCREGLLVAVQCVGIQVKNARAAAAAAAIFELGFDRRLRSEVVFKNSRLGHRHRIPDPGREVEPRRMGRLRVEVAQIHPPGTARD